MGRFDSYRVCEGECSVCSKSPREGRIVPEHEWSDHCREKYASKKQSQPSSDVSTDALLIARLVLGTTVNNEAASLGEERLWNDDPRVCVSILAYADVPAIEPGEDELLAAFSSMSLDSDQTQVSLRSRLSGTIKRGAEAIEGKINKSLLNINHLRNMKRLEKLEKSLTGLKTDFATKEKADTTISEEILASLHASAETIGLELKAIRGKTLPVQVLRLRLNHDYDTLWQDLAIWIKDHQEKRNGENPRPVVVKTGI